MKEGDRYPARGKLHYMGAGVMGKGQITVLGGLAGAWDSVLFHSVTSLSFILSACSD